MCIRDSDKIEPIQTAVKDGFGKILDKILELTDTCLLYTSLRRDVDLARTDKEARLPLLCKDFNTKHNSAQAWLRSEDFMYVQEKQSLENFRCWFCLGALDCSQTTDLTNLKLLFMRPNDNTKYVFSH